MIQLSKQIRKSKKILIATRIIITLFVIFSSITFLSSIFNNIEKFTERYNPKSYERKYNNSQYVIPNSKHPISDDEIYSHAAYSYAKGLNPILINSDHPPLGKYIIGWITILTGNHRIASLLFGMGFLIVLSAIIFKLTKSWWTMAIGLSFVMSDTVFQDQLLYSPLLDLFQAFFMLCFFYFILKFIDSNRNIFIILSGLSLGAMASTKMFFPAIILLMITGFFFFLKRYRFLKYFTIISSLGFIATVVYILTYIQYFRVGNNFYDFLSSQKWIFLYWRNNSVIDAQIPGSIFPFLLFNKWYVWWGNEPIIHYEHWSILWPIYFIPGFLLAIHTALRSLYDFFHRQSQSMTFKGLLSMWIIIVISYLSLVPISPRYLLLFNAPMFILISVSIYQLLLNKNAPSNHSHSHTQRRKKY